MCGCKRCGARRTWCKSNLPPSRSTATAQDPLEFVPTFTVHPGMIGLVHDRLGGYGRGLIMIRLIIRMRYVLDTKCPIPAHAAVEDTLWSALQALREDLETGKDYETACDACKGPADKLCPGCHLMPYCSTECQKSGWAAHKAICKQEYGPAEARMAATAVPQRGPSGVAAAAIPRDAARDTACGAAAVVCID